MSKKNKLFSKLDPLPLVLIFMGGGVRARTREKFAHSTHYLITNKYIFNKLIQKQYK